jgi:hypothetical protein
MVGTDPWQACAGGGADEIEEFLEPNWALIDYPAAPWNAAS